MSQHIVKFGKQLTIDGFIYNKSRDIPEKGKTYWDCRLMRSKRCGARAITSFTEGDQTPEIFKGPQHTGHDHAVDPDECKAELIKYRLKQEGEKNPERPPSRLVQDELRDVSTRVIAKLPERENLKRTIRTAKRRILPPNPKTLGDVAELPAKFKSTLTGDKFLIYDSKVDGGELPNNARVLVFATRRNLEMLSTSETWFFDGTFSVRYPSISYFTKTNKKKLISYVNFCRYLQLYSRSCSQYWASSHKIILFLLYRSCMRY